jgi:hypothetical protein
MAQIRVAHLRARGIDFAVFAADAPSRLDTDRARLVAELTRKARAAGLKIDKAALAFTEGGRVLYFGTPDLVRYLASNGVARWTHRLNV